MHRLFHTLAAVVAAASLAGCCHTAGCVDPCTGVMQCGGCHSGCPLMKPFSLLGGHGCGSCGCSVTPAAPCCHGAYGAAPVVGSYPGSVVTTPASGGYVTPSVPSVPAGIYDEAVPEKPVPNPSTEAKTGSIILQKHRSDSRRKRSRVREAHIRRWLPAGL